jgi:hypothetical protein
MAKDANHDWVEFEIEGTQIPRWIFSAGQGCPGREKEAGEDADISALPVGARAEKSEQEEASQSGCDDRGDDVIGGKDAVGIFGDDKGDDDGDRAADGHD